MEPRTYQTKPNAKDCYWSRTTGGGGISANDFVGFAPVGVTVTVYPGEGFESTRCGVWTMVGKPANHSRALVPSPRWAGAFGVLLAGTSS